MTRPRYQDIYEIREIIRENGASIRVIIGILDGITGPVTGICSYLNTSHPSIHPIDRGQAAFAYMFAGAARLQDERWKGTLGFAHTRPVVIGDRES